MVRIDDCVERLASVVGLAVAEAARYDWVSVEASLGGLRLPADYKRLVETFPAGRFQRFVSIIRPGDKAHSGDEYLGYYRFRLEDMRMARADEADPAVFPYPIFPEEGGLLPWGEGPRGELFYWRTGAAEPSSWDVVVSDQTWTKWDRFTGTTCQFLMHVVSNEFEGNVYVGAQTPPMFEPQIPIKAAAEPGPPWLTSKRRAAMGPPNEFSALASAMPQVTWEVERPDWALVENELGRSLPPDYKSFLNTFGPGRFCDIEIVGVDSCGRADLLALLNRNAEEARRFLSASRGQNTPFYPDPTGIISWGETAEGRICGWGPNGSDAANWGVVVAKPFPKVRSMAYFESLSFSAFLLKYSGYDGDQSLLVSRRPWEGGVKFAPHKHSE